MSNWVEVQPTPCLIRWRHCEWMHLNLPCLALCRQHRSCHSGWSPQPVRLSRLICTDMHETTDRHIPSTYHHRHTNSLQLPCLPVLVHYIDLQLRPQCGPFRVSLPVQHKLSLACEEYASSDTILKDTILGRDV